MLIDEALTPDSSRYWEAAAWRPGTEPASFDKQFVRNWLDASGWDHESTPPELPAEVVAGTRERYVEAFRRLTGRSSRTLRRCRGEYVTRSCSRRTNTPGMLTAEKIRAIHELVDAAHVGIVFQPIADIHKRRILAYEALARNSNSLFKSTPEMFAAAVQAGRVAELGRLHRDQAVRLCPHYPLFLNIDPHEFDYGWLVRPDDPIFRHRHPITVEITESVPIKYFTQCHSVLAEIRQKGMSLAIDDLGAGFSNLKYIADLQPEIVKLDRELILGCAPGNRPFKLLCSIVSLCKEMNAKTVAEGIETLGEFEAAVEAGVDYAQGYLLGRPACPAPDLIWPGTSR